MKTSTVTSAKFKITATWGNPPQIGDTYAHPHTGKQCRIVAVRDFGTMDIETGNERFRVTGLSWGLVAFCPVY